MHDRDRHAFRQVFARVALVRIRRILYPENSVGVGERLFRATNTLGLDAVRILAQPCRVDELHGQAVDVDLFAQYVAGRTGHLGHDRVGVRVPGGDDLAGRHVGPVVDGGADVVVETADEFAYDGAVDGSMLNPGR